MADAAFAEGLAMTDTTAPLTMSQLQNTIATWHRSTFPGAPTAAVGLKMAEEAGELAKAVNRLEHTDAGDRMNLMEELGDVAITLMVIAERYGYDLEALIELRIMHVMARTRGDV